MRIGSVRMISPRVRNFAQYRPAIAQRSRVCESRGCQKRKSVMHVTFAKRDAAYGLPTVNAVGKPRELL